MKLNVLCQDLALVVVQPGKEPQSIPIAEVMHRTEALQPSTDWFTTCWKHGKVPCHIHSIAGDCAAQKAADGSGRGTFASDAVMAQSVIVLCIS